MSKKQLSEGTTLWDLITKAVGRAKLHTVKKLSRKDNYFGETLGWFELNLSGSVNEFNENIDVKYVCSDNLPIVV